MYLMPSIRNASVGGSLWPASFFALAFPMHAIWFAGSLKGFAKRARARAAAAEGSSSVIEIIVQEAKADTLALVPAIAASVPPQQLSDSTADAPLITFPRSSEIRKLKSYPPTTHTLPTTPGARHRHPLRAIQTASPSGAVAKTGTSYPQRPRILRRRSLISEDNEEAIRRLAHTIGEVFPPARAPAIAVRKAVAVGRGVREAYNRGGFGMIGGAAQQLIAAL